MNTPPLEGFYSHSQKAVKAITPLPDKECLAVLLSVWTENDNDNSTDVDTTKETIYYGFSGNPVHPVKAGETSPYIYVSNLNQISVRCSNKKSAGTQVRFSCFRKAE